MATHFQRQERFASRIHIWNPSVGLWLSGLGSHSYASANRYGQEDGVLWLGLGHVPSSIVRQPGGQGSVTGSSTGATWGGEGAAAQSKSLVLLPKGSLVPGQPENNGAHSWGSLTVKRSGLEPCLLTRGPEPSPHCLDPFHSPCIEGSCQNLIVAKCFLKVRWRVALKFTTQ